MPAGSKPDRERSSGSVEDGACRHRGAAAASCAHDPAVAGPPPRRVAAGWADEARGQPQPREMAGFLEVLCRNRQSQASVAAAQPIAAVVLRLVSCRPIRDRVQENLFRRSSRSLGVFLRWSPPGPRAGAIFSLEEIPAFSLVVVAAPVDRLVRLGIARDMLRAMDVCLGYGD